MCILFRYFEIKTSRFTITVLHKVFINVMWDSGLSHKEEIMIYYYGLTQSIYKYDLDPFGL